MMGRAVVAICVALNLSCSGASAPDSFSSTVEGTGSGGGTAPGGIVDSAVRPGSDGSSDDGGGATTPFEEIGVAYCDFIERCASEFGPTFQSNAQCRELIAIFADLGGGFGSPDLFSVDRQLLSQCLSAVATTSCDVDFGGEAVPGCDFEEIFVGTLPVGACCDERGGCEPGSFCEGADGESLGSCVAYVGANGDCSNARCAPGLRCEQAEEGATCQPERALGESCDVGECADPYFCAGAPAGICSEPLGAGAACESDRQCASLECDETCQPAIEDPLLPGLGESCTEACRDGALGSLFCVPDPGGQGRVCVTSATSAGAPCDPEGVNAPECNPLFGLVCDAETSQCAALPRVGESCESLCTPIESAYCDGVLQAGQCQERIPAGGACEPLPFEVLFVSSCELGFTCQNGTCQAASLGAPICSEGVSDAR